jgi:tRNA (guanine37-N1)-methyltransferase
MWQVKLLTLFPEIFPGPLQHSVVGNACKTGKWHLHVGNIRDYALDKHKQVDDAAYGGGTGMVLKPDVIGRAIEDFFLKDNNNEIIYLSPRGKTLTQKTAFELATNEKGINIICGRFEGIDERVLKEYKIRELSIGDYVLSSGDVAAFVLLDACVRMLPGVLDGDALSEESFGLGGEYESLLEYPQYTRPVEWKGRGVPEVLTSGNHAKIEAWRLEEAKKITKFVRPDLWDQCNKGDKK